MHSIFELGSKSFTQHLNNSTMKKKLLILVFFATVIGIYTVFTGTGCTGPSKGKTSGTISNSYANPPFDMLNTQQSADTFSWRTFIALCWPADKGTCGPDTSNGSSILNGKGEVVWETYLNSEQVFVQPPARPDSWCAHDLQSSMYSRLPKNVQDLAQKTGIYRFAQRLEKSTHGMISNGQVFGGALVDQNGRFVRYEVKMNQTEYTYITQNELWDSAGQSNFKGAVDFPGGTAPGVGCIEIKAAWKVMGAGDDTTKFYRIKAIVFNDAEGNNPSVATLGLVGLHIIRKTPSQRDWIWATFEQNSDTSTSFSNPNSKEPVNSPPVGKDSLTELDWATQKPLHKPTQVKMVNAISDTSVPAINAYYQNMVKGSVWENYHLVSTQWLVFGESITPSFLANVTLETYLQGPHPASYGAGIHAGPGKNYFQDPAYQPFSDSISSSCMGCHFQAGINPKFQSGSGNFSFMLGDAKGVKR